MEKAMENAAYLRRQAALCLRLSGFCLDPPVAERLRTMAAGFHERALTVEFVEEFCPERGAFNAADLRPAA
jgi:hypothetical protein